MESPKALVPSQLDNAAVVVGCGLESLGDATGHPYRIKKQHLDSNAAIASCGMVITPQRFSLALIRGCWQASPLLRMSPQSPLSHADSPIPRYRKQQLLVITARKTQAASAAMPPCSCLGKRRLAHLKEAVRSTRLFALYHST